MTEQFKQMIIDIAVAICGLQESSSRNEDLQTRIVDILTSKLPPSIPSGIQIMEKVGKYIKIMNVTPCYPNTIKLQKLIELIKSKQSPHCDIQYFANMFGNHLGSNSWVTNKSDSDSVMTCLRQLISTCENNHFSDILIALYEFFR